MTFSAASRLEARSRVIAAAPNAYSFPRGLVAPLVGTIAWARDTSALNEVLQGPLPREADVEALRQAGRQQTLIALRYGLGAGLPPFGLGLALLGLGLITRFRAEAGA